MSQLNVSKKVHVKGKSRNYYLLEPADVFGMVTVGYYDGRNKRNVTEKYSGLDILPIKNEIYYHQHVPFYTVTSPCCKKDIEVTSMITFGASTATYPVTCDCGKVYHVKFNVFLNQAVMVPENEITPKSHGCLL